MSNIADKYTPERVQKIINALKAGNYPHVAARYAGITPKTFETWKELFPEFALAVDEADAAGEIRNIAIVQRASEKHWQAAAWLNERKYPERWGRVDRVEIWQIQKQAESMVEELKAEGLIGPEYTAEDLIREREALKKRTQNALPAPFKGEAA